MSMCKKMLTFSYDDGIYQDERLVEIFNKYGMKATFNLNTGIQSPCVFIIFLSFYIYYSPYFLTAFYILSFSFYCS